MITNKYIHDIIKECIDSIRLIALITDIEDLEGGTQKIYCTNTINQFDIISIGGNEYQVLSRDNTFIELASELEFVEGMVVNYLTPYYLHEKKIKANHILSSKEVNSLEKFKKYPLILLLRPWQEESTPDWVNVNNLHILILNSTEQEWDATERYTYNFIPVLDPLYDALLNAFCQHGEILHYSIHDLEHTREDGCLIDGNPLPDQLDGILLKFNNLHIRRTCYELR